MSYHTGPKLKAWATTPALNSGILNSESLVVYKMCLRNSHHETAWGTGKEMGSCYKIGLWSPDTIGLGVRFEYELVKGLKDRDNSDCFGHWQSWMRPCSTWRGWERDRWASNRAHRRSTEGNRILLEVTQGLHTQEKTFSSKSEGLRRNWLGFRMQIRKKITSHWSLLTLQIW